MGQRADGRTIGKFWKWLALEARSHTDRSQIARGAGLDIALHTRHLPGKGHERVAPVGIGRVEQARGI